MAWLPATTSVSSVAARLAIGTATLLYGFPDVRKDARIETFQTEKGPFEGIF